MPSPTNKIRFLNNSSVHNTLEVLSSVQSPIVAGLSSLTLKPDITTVTDQYVIIEPTAPSEIHIRAGGDIDQSSADLLIGGEKTYVKISDSTDDVYIRTTSSGNDQYVWTFDDAGVLTLPISADIKNSDGVSVLKNPIVDTITANVSGYFNNLCVGIASPISGAKLSVLGNIYIDGSIVATGSSTFVNTYFTTTSSISVTNNGTGPALVVNQTGEQAIAAFYDDNSISFYIDGKTGSAGFVGIGTETPNEKLTIVGNVSATGNATLLGNTLTIGDQTAQVLITNPPTNAAHPTAQRMVLQGVNGYGSGEGTDIYIWTGDGGTRGQANPSDSEPSQYLGTGGDIKLDAGTGSEGGTIKIRGGYSQAASSDTSSAGGFVLIEAGDSQYGPGGNIDVRAGAGGNGNGNITLQTSNTYNLVLSSSGDLYTPSNLTVNGTISSNKNIYSPNMLNKYVSSFGNTVDVSYTLDHNLGTEDVVVTIIDTATKEVVYPTVTNTALNQITVVFSDAPGNLAYKAIVIG